VEEQKKHYLHHLAPGFDRSAVLEELMTEYGDDVWNFAYVLTRRRDAADDIAQEVFLAAYNQMYAFRGESSVKSWLLAIARNKSLNYWRSAFIRKVVPLDLFVIRGKHREAADSAEQVAMDRAMSRDIWNLVLSLPVKYREALVLAYHYELSIEEIADTLGLPVGTVKSRLFRARRKMSELLEARERRNEQ
jgi:RNA polymerase sigma-70 factor, ECF subfamily